VTRTRIRTLVVATGVVALIAGCGTPQAGSAAVVGTRRISVSELQAATVDAQAFVGPSVPVSQRQVLYLLAASPFIEQLADRFGVGVSADDARVAMARTVPHPSPSGIQVVQANEALLAVQQLGDQQASVANTIITKGLVADGFTVNPRYGTFNTAIGRIAPIQPNWQPTPSPTPTAPAPTPSP
jgi:hypothetical protein